MKTKTKTFLAILVAGTSIWALAQEFDGPPPAGGPRGPGMRGPHHRPPPPPILLALDTNHDGVIDADEIANAPQALKALDKNGDGKLTFDELCPPRPDGPSQGHRHGPPPDDSGPPPGEDR